MCVRHVFERILNRPAAGRVNEMIQKKKKEKTIAIFVRTREQNNNNTLVLSERLAKFIGFYTMIFFLIFLRGFACTCLRTGVVNCSVARRRRRRRRYSPKVLFIFARRRVRISSACRHACNDRILFFIFSPYDIIHYLCTNIKCIKKITPHRQRVNRLCDREPAATEEFLRWSETTTTVTAAAQQR